MDVTFVCHVRRTAHQYLGRFNVQWQSLACNTGKIKQDYKIKDIIVIAITNYTNSDLCFQMCPGRCSKLNRVFQKI